jgi:hypothetical protein
MWYIKRGKKYLSVFGGWRSPKNKTVRFNFVGKPLVTLWFEELERFSSKEEAYTASRNKGLKNVTITQI